MCIRDRLTSTRIQLSSKVRIALAKPFIHRLLSMGYFTVTKTVEGVAVKVMPVMSVSSTCSSTGSS